MRHKIATVYHMLLSYIAETCSPMQRLADKPALPQCKTHIMVGLAYLYGAERIGSHSILFVPVR